MIYATETYGGTGLSPLHQARCSTSSAGSPKASPYANITQTADANNDHIQPSDIRLAIPNVYLRTYPHSIGCTTGKLPMSEPFFTKYRPMYMI